MANKGELENKATEQGATDGELGKAKLKEYLTEKFGQANQVDYKFYSMSKKGKIIAFFSIFAIAIIIGVLLWIFVA